MASGFGGGLFVKAWGDGLYGAPEAVDSSWRIVANRKGPRGIRQNRLAYIYIYIYIYIHIDNSGVVAVSGSEENSGTSLGVAAGGFQALPA